MAGYQPYPEYRNSGADWLGESPLGWKRLRADFVVKTNRTQVTPDWLEGKEVIHYSIPNVQEYGSGVVEAGDDIDSAKLLISEPQLLVSKLNPRKATLCLVEPSEEYPVVASSEFVPIMPGTADAKYTYYLWSSDVVTRLLSSQVQSVTRSHQRVNPTDILKIDWVWPSLSEQKTIARFLDHKTAQIDALVAKKEALLEKLAEKRTALISHAVTKGLDLQAKMKDSSVEWLGQVPEHWEVKRLRFLMTMSGGMTPSTAVANYWDGDIPWVSPKDMKSERIVSSIDTLTDEALKATPLRLYPVGKVLIVVRGLILAHTFPVAVNDVPVTVNQDMKVLDTVVNPEYLAILLRGIQSIILSVVEESAHGTKVLRTDLLKNIVLSVPPRIEQDEIVAEVNRVTQKSDRMVEGVLSAVDRLKEYRSALITQAVTGKIDVRGIEVPVISGNKILEAVE